MNRIKSNNKGITLVELIVVIAVMAVLTAAFAVSFTLISRQRVSNAASSTKSTIQLAQTYAKSRGSCYMTIEGTDDGSNTYIWTVDGDGNPVLGNGPNNINKNITTKVQFDNGEVVELTDGVVVKINFNRATGGFEKSTNPVTGNDATPMKIIFTNGEKESTLFLAAKTGLVVYESQM